MAALALAVLSTVLVMRSQRDVGIARDEMVYMGSGSHYVRWWRDLFTGKDGTFTHKAITTHFGGPRATDNNREHPPLVKTLAGVSKQVFHDQLGLLDEISAYRLPTALLNAVLVVLVFLMASRLWGQAEGIVAAALTLMLPRGFFHAGLTCFDAPIAAMWFATIYVYWRALESRRWMWAAGAVFGLALATKHNALLLPLAIGTHYLWISFASHQALWKRARRLHERDPLLARWRALAVAAAQALGRGFVKRRPWVIVSFAVLGPLTLMAVWPWLWFDPYAHLRDWIGFHLDHVHYNFEYLGTNWNAPPFPRHVALVTTLFTVPVVTLLAGSIGVVVLIQRWRRGEAVDAERAPGVLLWLSALASMGPFLLGSTPIFGAEKHWAPAIPGLCIAAAVGAVWAARQAIGYLILRLGWEGRREEGVRALAMLLVVGGVIAAATLATLRAQPNALTQYNALAGGAAGGADLGMNRQFWGIAARQALPYLNVVSAGQPTQLIYTHDASPAWGLYQRLGLAPRNLNDAGSEFTGGISRSQWALVIHERHFNRHDYLIWKAYGTVAPVHVVRVDGVPVVSIYRRPGP
jgi:hypothetical protein